MIASRKIVFLFYSCVIFGSSEAQPKRGGLKVGDGCKLDNGVKGTCRVFGECPAAIKSVKENKKWPKVCKYEGYTTIVCCDEGEVTTTTATTTTTPRPRPTSTESYDSIQSSEPGILSRRKCQEYSTWLSRPTLSFGDPNEDDGKIPGQCGAYVETFIIGGTEAEKLEFPHMAHLGFGEDIDEDELSWDCGGSLISEYFVLTAAHCLRKKDGTDVTHVRLGAGDPRSTIIVKIAEVYRHPNYNTTGLYNDIALLRLNRKVKFNDYRRPACLQVNRNFKNVNGTASGWGVTENDRKGSKKLLRVDLPFMTWDNCGKTYRVNPINLPRGIDDETMICAGALNLKKDTCQGDSGGPIQIVLKEPYCMYSIVGVTSFGIKCGIAPGVYTRVSSFVPWIENIVWKNPNLN